MSTVYKVLALKKFFSFLLCTLNVFGLWPFKFVKSSRHIKYNCFKAFYSAFTLCFGISTYIKAANYIQDRFKKKHFNSFTLHIATSINDYAIVIVFLFAYTVPHIYSRKIEIAFSRCRKILDVMNRSFYHDHIDIWTILLHIIVKTVLYEIIVIFLSFQSAFHGNMPKQVFVVMYLLLLPEMAVRLQMNVFYGALLAFNIYFKKLNESLIDTIAETKIIGSQHHLMRKYCQLSDRIDEISTTYFRLIEATKLVNGIFSMPITFSHSFILIRITINLLLLCVATMAIIKHGAYSLLALSVIGWTNLLLVFYDIYTTAFAAERLVNEVCKSANSKRNRMSSAVLLI